METPQPIKRSEYLAPLSREHHDALLLNWKIEKGLKHQIAVERIGDYCKWFFENHMLNHFKKEEESLVKVLPAEHELMKKMFADHEEIKAIMDDINKNPNADNLQHLGATVKAHVRFEERQLFNHIEEIATLPQLQMLATELVDEPTSDKWHDEFWL